MSPGSMARPQETKPFPAIEPMPDLASDARRQHFGGLGRGRGFRVGLPDAALFLSLALLRLP